jgi:hypothetical protein
LRKTSKRSPWQSGRIEARRIEACMKLGLTLLAILAAASCALFVTAAPIF